MRLPDVGLTFIVARREFLTRARSRFFVIGTVVLAVLLAGFIVLQSFLAGRPTTVNAGFEGGAQALAAPLAKAANSSKLTVDATMVGDLAAAKAEVLNGKLDLVVSGDPASPDVYVNDSIDPVLAATLDELVKVVALNRAVAQAGADPAVIDAAVAKATFRLNFLDPNAAQNTARLVVGIFVAALLYVTLLMYGQFVAQGVVEEKQNRIIEILLATIRPSQLLFGKVVGIGLLGLIQLVVLGAVALAVNSRVHVIAIPSIGADAVASGLLWFVLGFIFYALIYAAGGSLVSRQEDLQAVLAPITMLVVGTYLAFFWVVANPANPVAIGVSMLPGFAPVLMPARMASGQAQAWQVVVAVLLDLAATAGVTALAARIYTNSVLRVGGRVRLADAWRGERATRAPRAPAAAAPSPPGPTP